MFRILLIILLVGYALYKLGVFKIFTQAEVKGHNDNVNIDSAQKQDKKRSTFKGGEYVDYEDVKD